MAVLIDGKVRGPGVGELYKNDYGTGQYRPQKIDPGRSLSKGAANDNLYLIVLFFAKNKNAV